MLLALGFVGIVRLNVRVSRRERSSADACRMEQLVTVIVVLMVVLIIIVTMNMWRHRQIVVVSIVCSQNPNGAIKNVTGSCNVPAWREGSSSNTVTS